MKLVHFILTILFISLYADIYAQEWHQIYFPTKPNRTNAVFESYDKGYVLGGSFEPNSIPTNGLIIKTDINGQMLWSKTVSSTNEGTRVTDINPTNENGFILTGITGEQTNQRNPYIMKLNSCAELEWCRIYNTPNENDDWGQSIFQVPGGYLALFFAYGANPANERIWLYRLDNDGDQLWKQVYAQSDPAIINEEGIRLHLTPDYHYIINGVCYYPDFGIPFPSILRPFIIKTDSTGALEWEIPWAVVNGENFYGESYNSVTDNYGMIYSSGRHIIIGGSNPGDKPCMIKTDSNGNEISYTEFFPNSTMGGTYTINLLFDSTLVFGYGYDGNVGAIKCDNVGNILKIKTILNAYQLFSDAVTTFDNKLLLVGGFWDSIWRSHAYKLNSDLEFDSIYTQPFVYDSLCPYPIPSDTIPLNCLLVGMEELSGEDERNNMSVYPNPAAGTVHIVLPGELKTVQQAAVFTVTTWREQWETTELEVYDLFGRIMYSRELPFAEKEVTLDISGWKAGMYLIRLAYRGATVCSSKLIKR